MDTQKFGTFVAAVRKEQNMTQADLAAKLRVTDKAVSRWERGLGFPDINTLEPLADALGVTLLELMRSERIPEPALPVEEAAEALTAAVTAAKLQRKKFIRNLLLLFVSIFAVIIGWFTFTGFTNRSDVAIWEHAVLPSEDAMLIRAGVFSSMGYIRDCRNVSDDPSRAELRFHSAFGGFNSSLGAKSCFIVPLSDECTAVYIGSRETPELVKGPDGTWYRPE